MDQLIVAHTNFLETWVRKLLTTFSLYNFQFCVIFS